MTSYQPPYQYVLDTSALFDLKNLYPQRIFTGIWENFNEMCNQKYIVCPKEVLNEIKRGDDLLEWAEMYDDIFLEPCEGEINHLQTIMSFYPSSITEKYGTRPWADPMVLACAKYFRLPIIQHEIADAKQFKIPAIAQKIDVKCIRLVDLFDDQSWKF